MTARAAGPAAAGPAAGAPFCAEDHRLERRSQVVFEHDGEPGQREAELVHVRLSPRASGRRQVAALHERLAQATSGLLFVNAGVTNGPGETVADVSTDTFVHLMVTNALSPMRVVETLEDLVAPNGTIAVMSSGQGSVANNDKGGFEVYRASKSALNQLMRSFAARHAGDPRTLLLMAPGWVQTGLGGPAARLTTGQSIPGVADTIEAQAAKGGLQYLDYQGQTVPW